MTFDHSHSPLPPSNLAEIPLPELIDDPVADVGLLGIAAHLRLLLTALALEADCFREKLSVLTDIDKRFIEAEMRAAEIFSKAAALEQRIREISDRSKPARYDSRHTVSWPKPRQQEPGP